MTAYPRERGEVKPSLMTRRDLVRACDFDLRFRLWALEAESVRCVAIGGTAAVIQGVTHATLRPRHLP